MLVIMHSYTRGTKFEDRWKLDSNNYKDMAVLTISDTGHNSAYFTDSATSSPVHMLHSVQTSLVYNRKSVKWMHLTPAYSSASADRLLHVAQSFSQPSQTC